MTEQQSIRDNAALIKEVRAWTRADAEAAPRNLRRLALFAVDALENAIGEMHARELHHFEAEKAITEALRMAEAGLYANVHNILRSAIEPRNVTHD